MISRALKGDMVNPNSITDCGALDKIIAVDRAAESELRITNDKFNKLVSAADKNLADGNLKDPSKGKIDTTLKGALQVVRKAQERVTQQVQLLDDRYQSDCMVIGPG